jgi:hypothetical protein
VELTAHFAVDSQQLMPVAKIAGLRCGWTAFDARQLTVYAIIKLGKGPEQVVSCKVGAECSDEGDLRPQVGCVCCYIGGAARRKSFSADVENCDGGFWGNAKHVAINVMISDYVSEYGDLFFVQVVEDVHEYRTSV